MKNVLAIACGICDGKELGASARAALITRSFAELARLGRTLGARPETLSGLSGLGDLILTASSPLSRNYSLGLELGRGARLADVLARSKSVCEGVYTAGVAVELAGRHAVDVPVCRAVAGILAGNSTPDDEIARLLSRPLKPEDS